METIFLNAAGTVQFVRDDMEQGNWTQEEYTVNMTFPFDPAKVITFGMRVAFADPATGNLEMFEIQNVTNIEPDHYQQIIGEHIAVSELTDEHIDTTEITNKTASQALTTALTGTLWSVGNNTASGTSSVDFGRGSVWQAVNVIQTNWNVYITPRVTLNASGAISGRYLDIAPAVGVWRGVRLSIDRNMVDSSVVYDASEILTAMYGYGGTVDKAVSGQDDTQETLTFASVTWSATSSHPAKPSGQTFIEDPAKTALYGRNGRPRYGFYQNAEIKDANILLEKTWQALKQTSEPKISISGTVEDLYRLGYKDQPMRLHDTAIVEVRPTGETFQKTIIRLSLDLLDPTASRPEIGDYIPNIIYINRDTKEIAETGKTGGRGGGGGGRGSTTTEYEEYDTYSGFEKDHTMIAMVVGTRNGDTYIKAGEIGLAINQSGTSGSYETTAYINADHVNISATNTAYTLAGDMEHDSSGRLVIKNASGLYVTRNSTILGVWDQGNLTGSVMVQQINGQSSVKISGDVVDINGSSIVINANRIDVNGILTTNNIASVVGQITTLTCQNVWADSIQIRSSYGISSSGRLNCSGITINQGAVAEWKSKSVVTGVTASGNGNKTYALTSDGTTVTGSVNQNCITSVVPSYTTINYIGTSDG